MYINTNASRTLADSHTQKIWRQSETQLKHTQTEKLSKEDIEYLRSLMKNNNF